MGAHRELAPAIQKLLPLGLGLATAQMEEPTLPVPNQKQCGVLYRALLPAPSLQAKAAVASLFPGV